MAERDLEQLVITLSTNVNQLAREFKKANQIVVNGFNEQEKSADKHAKKLAQIQAKAGRDAGAAFSSAFKATMGSALAALSVKELAEVADSYTRIGNALKLAGVQASLMAGVQERLFEAAQKNGVEWESLAKLYGRAAQSQKALGISTADTLELTKSVAAAIKIQGGDVEAARGAMLQLSQALATGTVRAEEYNSINEGMLPVLQAVANNNAKYGGSIAKVRQAMLDGKLSSKELATALIEQRGAMEKLAATANSTLGQSMERLKNAFILYIGQADNSVDATKNITKAIDELSKHLDLIIPVIAIIAGSLGLGAMITAMTNATVAAGGLRAATLAAFGGPVGIAISAITIALLGVAAAERELIKPGQEYVALTKNATDAGFEYEKAASAAARATDKEAQALRDAAAIKREALVQSQKTAKAKLDEARATILAANVQMAAIRNAPVEAGLEGDAPTTGGQLKMQTLRQQKALNELAEANKALKILADEIAAGDAILNAKAAPHEETAAEKKKREAAEKKAERERIKAEKKAAREAAAASKLDLRQQDAFNSELARIQDATLDALDDRNQTAAESAAIAARRAALERAAYERDLALSVKQERATPEQALDLTFAKANQQVAENTRIVNEGKLQTLQEQADAADAEYEGQLAILQAQNDLTTSTKERRVIEGRILALQQQHEIALAEMAVTAAGDNKVQKQVAQARLDYLKKLQGLQTDLQTQQAVGPWGQFKQRQEAASDNRMEAVEQEAVDSIGTFSSAIADAAMGTAKFTDSLNNAIKQIEAQLIQMAVQGTVQGIAGLLGFAGGGDIRGPGTSTSDSIPILASNGEKMMNARANRKYGPILDAMNRGMVPRLATGGPVGSTTFSGGPASKKGGVVFDMRGAMIWEDEVANIMKYVDRGDTRATVMGAQLGASSARTMAQKQAINRMGR